MARSWSLDTTLSNSTGSPPNIVTGGDKLYFIENANQQAVISWDGTTETDISGATWSGTNKVQDLAYFSSTLYAAVDDDPSGYGCYIYSYDGIGQSWTLEFTPTIDEGGEDPAQCQFETGDNNNKWLATDDDRIVAVASSASNTRLWMSTDGSNWTEQTINGGTTYVPNKYLLGTFQTELAEITFIVQSGATRRAAQYDGGDDWAFVGSSIGSNGPVLAGYADSLSFFDNYVTEDVEYSSDYGVNRTATSISSPAAGADEGEPRVRYFSDYATMTFTNNQAYTWSSGSNDFVADGTTGSDNIIAFFQLTGTLYAFCDGGKIYDGGDVTPDLYELTHSADGIPGSILV